MSVIEAQHLEKSYGEVQALAGFDLSLPPGRILGLIGPNGSGKTTAIQTILGLIQRDAGSLSVLGLDPARHRARLMRQAAYIADTDVLPRWMKIADLIDCFAGLQPSFDRARFDAALADTEIRRDRRVRTLSKGMTVQLHLALVMAVDTRLLVLDEPTLGLDQIHRQRFYETLLGDLAGSERSVLITTHEVREVEHLLTDVVFIDHGRNVLTLEMDAIPARYFRLTTGPENFDAARAAGPLAELPRPVGRAFVYRRDDAGYRPSGGLADLTALGEVTTPDLAELFVAELGGH